MYNLKLNKNEKIILIDDYVLIKNNSEYLTVIITNKRLLVLDYPSQVYNSNEDLRISGRLNYIKMKEIILERKLTEISKITDDSKYSKIIFNDETYLELKSKDVTTKLKENLT